MNANKSNFKKHLEERILQLSELHTSLQAEEEKQRSIAKLLIDIPEEGRHPEDIQKLAVATMTADANNHEAAKIWDIKCDLEKLLPLYSLEHPDTVPGDQQKIEHVANFLWACIQSCENVYQLSTAEKMIENFSSLFAHTTQVTGWIDSLKFALHNKTILLHAL